MFAKHGKARLKPPVRELLRVAERSRLDDALHLLEARLREEVAPLWVVAEARESGL